jgi:hypothetical protein
MTKFQIIFFSALGLCILTIILAFASFDFIETDTAADWTTNYFALPIFLVTAPTSFFVYLKFLQQHEAKEYKSKSLTKARTAFRILMLSLGITGILFATTLSTIILTNDTGDVKSINLNAKIIDYHTTRNRGRTSHYIKIQDDQLRGIVELKVDRPFQIGQSFIKSMKIGRWGLLYSEK